MPENSSNKFSLLVEITPILTLPLRKGKLILGSSINYP